MIAYTYYENDNRVRRYAETLVNQGWKVDAVVLQSKGKPKKYRLRGVTVHGIQRRIPNEKGPKNYLFRLLNFLFRSTVFVTANHLFKRYKIIHVHSIPDFEVFAALLAKFMGSRVILDIHDIVPELFLNKFGKSKKSLLFKMLLFVERLSGFIADHVIIANHIWYNRIIERSVPENKCSVVMNFPDETIFSPRKRTRKDDGEFHMLYPGTLSTHQGIDTAIQAVTLLKDKAPDLRFHIYGTGTDEQLLKDSAAKLDLENRVIFHEMVSMEEVADIMADADLGVEPKIRNSFSNEAFSTKILEFMVLRVPVIASDTAVHKYYIPDDTVSYFPAGDANALADSIFRLYKDPALRNKLVSAADSFIKDYTWNNRRKEYLDLIKNLTNINYIL